MLLLIRRIFFIGIVTFYENWGIRVSFFSLGRILIGKSTRQRRAFTMVNRWYFIIILIKIRKRLFIGRSLLRYYVLFTSAFTPPLLLLLMFIELMNTNLYDVTRFYNFHNWLFKNWQILRDLSWWLLSSIFLENSICHCCLKMRLLINLYWIDRPLWKTFHF